MTYAEWQARQDAIHRRVASLRAKYKETGAGDEAAWACLNEDQNVLNRAARREWRVGDRCRIVADGDGLGLAILDQSRLGETFVWITRFAPAELRAAAVALEEFERWRSGEVAELPTELPTELPKGLP